MLVINPLVCIDFQVELLLDKLKQKGAIRRALFLHNRSPGHSKNMTISRGGQMQCEELIAYLRVRDYPLSLLSTYYFFFSSKWFSLSVNFFGSKSKRRQKNAFEEIGLFKESNLSNGLLRLSHWILHVAFPQQCYWINYDKHIS